MNQAITTCASCGYGIRSGLLIALADGRYGQIAHGETHYGSGLYNPGHEGEHTLCKQCHEYEERMMEENGTNNIPELLASYTASIRR